MAYKDPYAEFAQYEVKPYSSNQNVQQGADPYAEFAQYEVKPQTAFQEQQIPVQSGLINKITNGVINTVEGSKNLVKRGALDVLAGMLKGGQDVVNLPYNLTNELYGKGTAERGLSAINKVMDTMHLKGINPTLDLFLNPRQTDYGQLLGVNNPNILDKGIQEVASWVPGFGASKMIKLAETAPKLLKQAVIGTSIGATQGENPIENAFIGGIAAPVAIKAAKFTTGMLKNLLSNPKKITNNILNDLSGGLHVEGKNSIEIAKKNVASDIKNLFDKRKKKTADVYNQLEEQFGNEKLEANNVSKQITDNIENFPEEIKKKSEDFLKDPTYSKGFELSKMFGNQSGRLARADSIRPLDTAGLNEKYLYDNMYDSLRDSMSNFLESKGQSNITSDFSKNGDSYKDLFENLTEYYKDKVVPFRENPLLHKISKGKITNPAGLNRIFSSPEDNIKDIINDLPKGSIDKMLYSNIAKGIKEYTGKKITGKTLNNFLTLDDKGLGSYVTPELEQKFDLLREAFIKHNKAKKIAMYGAGGAALGAYPAHKLHNFLKS